MFLSRPDLSGILAAYASKFGKGTACQESLYASLSADPVYDAVAGDYVLALDRLVPRSRCRKFKRLASKLVSRSEEKSLLIRFPARLFTYKRMTAPAMVPRLCKEIRPSVVAMLLHHLAFNAQHASMTAKQLETAIRKFAASPDPDLARYCTYLMLTELKLFPRRPTTAGRLLLLV